MISAANEDGSGAKSDGSEENRGEAGRVSEDVGEAPREEEGAGSGVVADDGAGGSAGADSVALGGEFRASVSGVGSGNGRSEEDGVRVCSSADGGSPGGADEEVKPGGFEFKSEKSGEYWLDDVKGGIRAEDDLSDACDREIGSQGRLEVDGDGSESINSGGTAERKSLERQYDSLLSEFDEYVANEKTSSSESGMSRALSYGFEVGDMVWGKVKSHPWWPGQIFNEVFATSSVRRSRRDGYVLVAFFGDSSYGWFDPAELIPFDENFIEKSSQTISRNFAKAVEEAMDEASRRSGLGLACRCRNAFSFRPTHVQGYFSVDVPDYEQGGLYSTIQISKARDSFQPRETLAFIEQLALMPQGSDEKSLEFVKNKAIVFAYRKAVFEEYDETYAQAFGVQAVRPSHDPVDPTAQPAKVPPRALLSGPLVIAEALGSKRASTKPMKVKDPSKKDKYLFKRRDESGTQQASPVQANSSVPAAYVDGSLVAAGGGYILQKRASSIPVNSQIPVKLEQTQVTADAISSQGGPGISALHQVPESGSAIKIQSPSGLGGPNVIGKGEDAKIINSQDGSQQRGQESYTVQDSGYVSPLSTDVVSADGAMRKKKKKVLGHPVGEPSSQNVVMREKKKKKRKEIGLETGSDHPRKRLLTSKVGVSVAKVAGKLTQVDSASREESYADKQKKGEASRTHPDDVGMVPTWSGNAELDLRQLLNGLQALALDPFYGIERSNPAVTKQAFLRFRSLVYQKSLILAPPSETDTVEIRPAKSPAGVGAADQSTGESVRKLSSSKSTKPTGRFDDPAKSGRKRPPSDRQEEIEAKRLKKIHNIKSLAAEKRAIQKTQDAPRGEGRETVSATPKQAKPFPVKKVESHPARASDPTILVMKFPPGTSLPSVTELKARFARFGPLDYSGIRVFWKSSTCRVVFHRKLDAEAAYKYAAGNNNLFGNAGVRYSLRDAEVPASEASESGKGRGNDSVHDTPRLKDPSTERSGPASTVQLKSCLKKSSGDDPGVGPTTGNGGRAAARVKFVLGGEETNRQEQKMVDNANNFNDKNNNGSFADGGASSSSSSSLAMVYNSKNFQRAAVSSSPLPPLLPLPPLAKPQLLNNNASLPTEISPPPRSAPNFNVTVDISHQMITLLTRCNDVVTNLSGLLGYVPYHPL